MSANHLWPGRQVSFQQVWSRWIGSRCRPHPGARSHGRCAGCRTLWLSLYTILIFSTSSRESDRELVPLLFDELKSHFTYVQPSGASLGCPRLEASRLWPLSPGLCTEPLPAMHAWVGVCPEACRRRLLRLVQSLRLNQSKVSLRGCCREANLQRDVVHIHGRGATPSVVVDAEL